LSNTDKFDIFQSAHALKTIVCPGNTSTSAIAGVVDIDQTRRRLFQLMGGEIPGCF
jgi:hypothetical protein